MERYGRIEDMDRSLDNAYWQRLGPAAIFYANSDDAVETEGATTRTANSY